MQGPGPEEGGKRGWWLTSASSWASGWRCDRRPSCGSWWPWGNRLRFTVGEQIQAVIRSRLRNGTIQAFVATLKLSFYAPAPLFLLPYFSSDSDSVYHYIYKFKKMEAHYNFNFAPAMTRQLPLYSKLWIVGGILAVACTCTVSKVWQILGHLLCMTNEDVCNKWQQFSHKSPHRCQHIFM